MLGTKYNNSTVIQKACSLARDYKTTKALQHELNNEPNSNSWRIKLQCPIITTIAKGSHICSHQGIGDHWKKENYKKTNTSKRV